MINPGKCRVKRDTDSALYNRGQLEKERERERERRGLESSLCMFRNLSHSPCLSHAQAMCSRHITCRCRDHPSWRGSMRARAGDGVEGKGGEEEEMESRAEGDLEREEAVEITD